MSERQIDNILLVEDDDNDAELIMNALSEYNIINNVHRVEDGEIALEYLRQQTHYKHHQGHIPGLIMLDLKLPKINGLSVLREIKQDENLRYIPVVALTSSNEQNDMETAYQLGVNAYVVKPIDFNQFMEAIKTIGGFWVYYNMLPTPQKQDGDKESS